MKDIETMVDMLIAIMENEGLSLDDMDDVTTELDMRIAFMLQEGEE